jgi:hypothetical protein
MKLDKQLAVDIYGTRLFWSVTIVVAVALLIACAFALFAAKVL